MIWETYTAGKSILVLCKGGRYLLGIGFAKQSQAIGSLAEQLYNPTLVAMPSNQNQPQLYKNIQALFAPAYAKPGFGKIRLDFLTAQKVNKGHGRIEKQTISTGEMLNAYAAWPGLEQVYRLQREFQ